MLNAEEFLSEFPMGDDDVFNISPSKDYQISAEHYQKFLDNNSKVNAGAVKSSGKNLSAQLELIGVPRGVALEIGCGAGAGSRPLVSSGYFSSYLVTDGSADLARITRESIKSLGLDEQSTVHYGSMLDSDLSKFPSSSVSAIFLFAALHHFLDWREMLRTCVRTLQPGGIVLYTDPCVESFLILSTLFLAFKSLHEEKNPGVDQSFYRPMQQLIGATKHRGNPYAPDKDKHEDKHFFQVTEMYRFAQEEGLIFRYYPNANVSNFSTEGVPPVQDFRSFLRRVLSNSQHFPPDLIDAFFSEMQQPLELLEYFWEAGQGPVNSFTGIMQRPKG